MLLEKHNFTIPKCTIPVLLRNYVNVYVTVHAQRGIFAYATEIVFLISFERASLILANGANGSVIAVRIQS